MARLGNLSRLVSPGLQWCLRCASLSCAFTDCPCLSSSEPLLGPAGAGWTSRILGGVLIQRVPGRAHRWKARGAARDTNPGSPVTRGAELELEVLAGESPAQGDALTALVQLHQFTTRAASSASGFAINRPRESARPSKPKSNALKKFGSMREDARCGRSARSMVIGLSPIIGGRSGS